jgi:hypothetical protein
MGRRPCLWSLAACGAWHSTEAMSLAHRELWRPLLALAPARDRRGRNDMRSHKPHSTNAFRLRAVPGAASVASQTPWGLCPQPPGFIALRRGQHVLHSLCR